jgi:hypothetical protein
MSRISDAAPLTPGMEPRRSRVSLATRCIVPIAEALFWHWQTPTSDQDKIGSHLHADAALCTHVVEDRPRPGRAKAKKCVYGLLPSRPSPVLGLWTDRVTWISAQALECFCDCGVESGVLDGEAVPTARMAGKPGTAHIEVAKTVLGRLEPGSDVYNQVFVLGQQALLGAKRGEGKRVCMADGCFFKSRGRWS